MDNTPGVDGRPQNIEIGDSLSDRVYLFPGADDVEAAMAKGLPAVAFNCREDELARREACIIAPREHLYSVEKAHDVAASALNAGALAAFIVDLPFFKRGTSFAEWLDVWGADGLADIAGSMEHSREWHPSSGPVGERPTIVVTTDEKEFNDAVLEALKRDPDLYCVGGVLASIACHGEAPRGVAYSDLPPPQVRPVLPAVLRERISARTRLAKVRRKGDVEELVPAHPPEWCVAAIHQRGEYPGFRPLAGIVQAPTIREDGTILDAPGYDPRTGLFYAPNATFEKVPAAPTRAAAVASRDVLYDVVHDFPFRSDADKALWLAALFTILARPSFSGPAPLFGFDGNCPGSGKTLLCDLAAILATGRPIPKMSYPGGRNGDEEMEKRITSLAMAAERMVLLDNVADPLGGAALDAALTTTSWKGRILGRSETVDLPLNVVWMASGNNLQCRGDLLRRALFARLESRVENPEDRQGFRHPDLIGHAREKRGRLVVAALTILRAWHFAGRPSTVKPLGSFEGWTRAVADPVAWITDVDPLGVRKFIKAADQEAGSREALVSGWAELPGSEGGIMVDRALKYLKDPRNEDSFQALRSALADLSHNADLPNARAIGVHLKRIEGRVIGGLTLRSAMDRTKTKLWRVERVAAGSAGSLQGVDSADSLHLNFRNGNGLAVGAGSAGSSFHTYAGENGDSPEFLSQPVANAPFTPRTPCSGFLDPLQADPASHAAAGLEVT